MMADSWKRNRGSVAQISVSMLSMAVRLMANLTVHIIRNAQLRLNFRED